MTEDSSVSLLLSSSGSGSGSSSGSSSGSGSGSTSASSSGSSLSLVSFDSNRISNSSWGTSPPGTNHGIQCVHLDKDWCPGTTKLRDIARKVAYENDCRRFSKRIGQQILMQMEGVNFYRSTNGTAGDDESYGSSDSDGSGENDSKWKCGFGCYTIGDEVDVENEDDVEQICSRDLHVAIQPFYDGERFLVQTAAHCRDVYFKHPNHPGTQAFVRASQQLVFRLGVATSCNKRTFKEMRKMLCDSRFFVGRAPECVEADEDDCDRIFRARYEFDRKAIKKVLFDERNRRLSSRTFCIHCGCCETKSPKRKSYFQNFLDSYVSKRLGFPGWVSLVAVLFISFSLLYLIIFYTFNYILRTHYFILGIPFPFHSAATEMIEEANTEGMTENRL